MRGVTVVVGPALSGKTARLLAEYRQVLATQSPGSALWLSPHFRSAQRVRKLALADRLKGCFSPNCLTFDQFARRVVETSSLRIRPIGPSFARRILKSVVDEALAQDDLPYFAALAPTRGFLDLAAEFIQDLKRLEIWPEELAAALGRKAGEKDRELCRLYARYQQLLTKHDLYDAEGLFWSARAQLRQGRFRPFERVAHVFVDGFADFTRTEHEMLELLAARVESLTVSLPLEIDSPRQQLFDRSTRTLAAFRRWHPELNVETLNARTGSWPVMAHLERNVFADPRQRRAAPSCDGVEIVAAASAQHEIEWIARAIKELLTAGDPNRPGQSVRPGDVLVVFRSLGETADLVRQTFERFGIPLAIAERPTLSRAPIVAALLAWLRLDSEDWPFRQLLAVLAHNYFRPEWPQWRDGRAATAAESIVHQLQIPAGRAALLRGVERLRQRPGSDSGEAARAQLAGQLLERIATALDGLPNSATPRDWASALATFAENVGLLVASGSGTRDDLERDSAAWRQLSESLIACQQLAQWLDQEPPRLSRGELIELVEDLARLELLQSTVDEAGRVRVLPAESARNLSAPYVFVAGLAEKSFPPAQQENCLRSEAETRQLAAAGLPLVTRAQRRAFEMLLFYEVITRATRRLVLSYPALDSRAEPLSPSPYLSEIEQVLGPGRVKRVEADLAHVPASDAVYCAREFRVRAVSQAVAGDNQMLRRLARHPATSPLATHIVAALRTSLDRQRGKSYGAFEGMLLSPAAGREFAGRYGAEHCWSPSQLEQYARCPFEFFLSRVLGIEPVDEPSLAIDYRRRGSMVHWLLATWHRESNKRLGRRGSPQEMSDREFLAEIQELLGQLQAGRNLDQAHDHGFFELDVRQVSKWLTDYRRQHGSYDGIWRQLDEPLRPAHFEVSFGPGPRGQIPSAEELAADGLSTAEPFELECAGETIRFSGRIDRIDVGTLAGQTVFSIVDYKSGRSQSGAADAIGKGYLLQLPLYALAAERMLAGSGAVPFRAAYWHVSGDGYKEMIKFHDEAGGRLEADRNWQSLEESLRRRVRSLVRGIRDGQFPMHSADDKCTSYCAFRTVCRVNQARSLEKSWQPPEEPAE